MAIFDKVSKAQGGGAAHEYNLNGIVFSPSPK